MPTTVEFVDIAGLVAGASQGEGLGNKFLAHIREVDAIAHVVRSFEDPDVVHVSGRVDPASDVATINTELGAVIHSPELAREMIRIIDVDRLRSAYRLRLNKEGTACEWVSVDDDDEELVITEEPDSTAWLRFKTWLLSPLVPESLL